MNNISVIIAVYNEETEIGKVLEQLKKKASVNSMNYEIIVVNDASTDNTQKIVEQFGDVILINNVSNLGYGASIKNGIKNAKYENIAIIDGDNTYPAEKITELLNCIKDCDMVVGKRNKIIYPKLNWIKQIGRFVIDLLCSYLTGNWIPDINSGLRIFRKGIVLKFIDVLCDRFSFTTSLTLLMFFHGYKIKYLEVDYCREPTDRQTKVRIWRDGLKTFSLVIKMGFRYVPIKMLSVLIIVFIVALFILTLIM